MSKQKIKIAVIGLGYWGPNLVRNFFKVAQAEVAFVCDLDEKRLKAIQAAYPGVEASTNYQDIIKNNEVDAVAIATPVATHFQIAKDGLMAGKHVLVEKPMTATVSQAQKLIALAKRQKRILMVDHTFVYTGAVRKIKELVDRGELGNIYYFDSQRVNLGLIRPDCNVVFDLAPHDFSIIDYLFDGRLPQAISTIATKHIYDHCEDMAHITMDYDNGIVGHINVSWLSPVKLRQILVGGSKKMVLYDDVEPTEKIKIYDKGIDVNYSQVTPFNPLYRYGDVVIPKLDQTETLENVCGHFVDCIIKGQEPVTNGQAGLRVVKLLEATTKSIKHRGRRIPI